MSVPDLTTLPDLDDPGDDTQLRFRYQHGYGVVLLCGAATGALPYIAVWCEHHEDLLGEKPNGQFDSFQIKTARPESGPWKMSSEQLWKSIGHFVELDARFPGKFDSHSFVSNVQCYDTKKETRAGTSPIRFFGAVQGCDTLDDLAPAYARTLQELAEKLKCEIAALFDTCKRVRIVKGPPLDGFESSIAHEHLPKLAGCATLAPAELDALRDELIQMVFNASSLAIDDPSKHWCCVLGNDRINPRLRAKRLVVTDTIQNAVASRALVFRFAPSSAQLKLGHGQGGLDTLTKKLLKGGLVNQLDSMRSRTLSAERHLLELVARNVDDARAIINQLTQAVQGACTDAEAIASAYPEPWGMEMYRQVVKRLERMAEAQPSLVHHQPHDCLMGVAGLLTEECKVWWSPRFDTEEDI